MSGLEEIKSFQVEAAKKELALSGKKLSEYPWPGDVEADKEDGSDK